MSALIGKDAKVSLGGDQVVGMGTWSIDFGSTDEYDSSEFGDEWEEVMFGLRRGGSITFDGHFYPADTTGQGAVEEAYVNGTDLTDLRLYYNSTSYWRPNRTAGYFSPTLTTGAGTPVSTARITSYNVGMDKAGLGSVAFTARISGSLSHN